MKKKNKNKKKEKISHSLIHLPNVSIHVLHTFFYTFPKLLTRRLSWTIKSFFSGQSFPLLVWNRLLFIVVVEWYYKFVLLSHDKVTWCRIPCHNQPYNAVPQPVDPIAWRRLAVSSRNVAFYINWPCRETTIGEEAAEVLWIVHIIFHFLCPFSSLPGTCFSRASNRGSRSRDLWQW